MIDSLLACRPFKEIPKKYKKFAIFKMRKMALVDTRKGQLERGSLVGRAGIKGQKEHFIE